MPIEKIPQVLPSFPYKPTVIIIILVKYLFEAFIYYRQIRKLSKKEPLSQELKEIGVEEENYQKTKEYSKAKMQFDLFESVISISIEISLIVFDYYALIWSFSIASLKKLNLNQSNEYYASFIFIVIEQIRETITKIPFSYIKTFNIEQKYGFNKSTKGLFVKDIIKRFIIQLIFTPIIYSLLILAISYGGRKFYITAEITVCVIILLAMWIYPNFIQPLFNKYTELSEGEIKTLIYQLAEKVKYPLKKIYMVDNSIRSAHSNAYLYGFGNNKRIVLFDTLIQKLSPQEIQAVLGHELGHWKHSHTLKLLAVSLIETFIMFYLFQFFMGNYELFTSFGFDNISIFIGLSLYIMVFTPLSFLINKLTLRLTRHFEYQADEFSFKEGFGELLKDGLKKLHETNLSDMDPDYIYSMFNNSHPTFLERVRALKLLKEKSA